MRKRELLDRIEGLERRLAELERVDAVGKPPVFVPMLVPVPTQPTYPTLPLTPWTVTCSSRESTGGDIRWLG